MDRPYRSRGFPEHHAPATEDSAAPPDVEGEPQDPEDLDDADTEERLEEDPEDVEINRREVPPTPENTLEARTRDGDEDEITRP